MKILYITNGYKPHRWAGTETYTAGIAEGMAARGHEVEILCAGEWEKGDVYWNGVSEDRQNGIRVRRIHLNWAKAPDPFRYLYQNPLVASYLSGLLQEERYDLVHITSCETLSASVFEVVRSAGLPMALTLTDFWMLCPRINLLRSDGSNCSGQTTPDECLDCMMMGNQVYRQARKFLPGKAISPLVRKVSQYPFLTRKRGLRGMAGDMADRKSTLMRALQVPDLRITASNFVRDVYSFNAADIPISVQPYGHDLAWLDSYQGKPPTRLLRLGYVGQISEAKGVHLILEALGRLSSAYLESVTLVIYGNVDHAPAYGRRIKELAAGLSCVRFGGTYQHAESAAVFSEIDVLVVPSLWYDFPLIIYEAFATQTPVIATNLGGMAEAINQNGSGLLFERGNAADLAERIQALLEDPDLMRRLRSDAPRVKTVGEDVELLEKEYLGLTRGKNRLP